MITSTTCMYCASGVSAIVPQQKHSLDVRGSTPLLETQATCIVRYLETDRRTASTALRILRVSGRSRSRGAGRGQIISNIHISISNPPLINKRRPATHHDVVACDMYYYATLPTGSRDTRHSPSVRPSVCLFKDGLTQELEFGTYSTW